MFIWSLLSSNGHINEQRSVLFLTDVDCTFVAWKFVFTSALKEEEAIEKHCRVIINHILIEIIMTIVHDSDYWKILAVLRDMEVL